VVLTPSFGGGGGLRALLIENLALRLCIAANPSQRVRPKLDSFLSGAPHGFRCFGFG